jgi:hypothetical protein
MGDFIDVKVRGDTFIDGSGWYYAMDNSGYMSPLFKYEGVLPAQTWNFLSAWPGISSGAAALVNFGYESPISQYNWYSEFNGTNETLMSLDVATRRLNLYNGSVHGNVTGSGNKGLLWYNATDLKWATYMAPAGSGYAIDGATANSGVFGGMTANSVRNRVQGGYDNVGWLWENSDNVAVMDLAGSAGNLNLKGIFTASGNVQSYNQFLFLDGGITTFDSGLGQYVAADGSGNNCQLINFGTNYSSIGTVDSTLVGATFRVDGRYNYAPFQWNIRLPGGGNAVVASMTSGGQMGTNQGYAVGGNSIIDSARNVTGVSGYFTAMSAGSGVLGNDLWLATGKNVKVNGANPFRTIVLTAGGGRPTATSGCSAYSANVAAANFVEYGSLDFGAGADSYAQWNLVMPANYDGGTIYAQFLWTAISGTAAQTVWWFIQGRAYGDNEAISGAFGTAVSGVDAYQTSGAVHISPATAAMTLAGTPTGGEYVVLRVYRDVDDTLAANAKLLGVKIRYGISSYSD